MILPIVLSPSWYVKGRAGSCMRPKATVGVCAAWIRDRVDV